MKKLSLILLSACILGVTGCTTTTYKQEEVQPVPSERLYSYQEALPNEAIVKLTRLENFGGRSCYFSFLIDDTLSTRLDVGEQAVFHLPAGEHKFQVTCDWNGGGLCGIEDEERCRSRGQIRYVEIKAGRTYDFRMGLNSWSGVFRLYTDNIGKPIGDHK